MCVDRGPGWLSISQRGMTQHIPSYMILLYWDTVVGYMSPPTSRWLFGAASQNETWPEWPCASLQIQSCRDWPSPHPASRKARLCNPTTKPRGNPVHMETPHAVFLPTVPAEEPANSQHPPPATWVKTPPENSRPHPQSHSQLRSLTRGALRHPGARAGSPSSLPCLQCWPTEPTGIIK